MPWHMLFTRLSALPSCLESMEKLGISDELRWNDLHHSSTTRTGGAFPMRVTLQLVMCRDDGREQTVADIVTLKKDS